MVEQRKRKPSAAAKTTQQTSGQAPATVGQFLAQKRMEKKLSHEDVSRDINIRAGQVKAIEDGRIGDLPGMTYALGFVRSYAQFLKLDVNDVVNRFKLEHAVASAPKPEARPIETTEDEKMPDHRLIAAAGAVFIAVLVWVLWPSSAPAPGGETAQTAEETTPESIVSTIPDPPKMEPVAPIPATSEPVAAVAPAAESDGVPLRPTEARDIPRIMPAPRPTATQLAAMAPMEPDEQLAPAAVAAPVKVTPVPVEQDAPDETIVVAPPQGKVVIRAVASAWVEVLDGNEKTVFKKVLKPGDQYFVPNLPGMSLRTSNAGGLEIYVSGKQAPAIGRSGEIVRGIELSPESLMRPRRTNRIRNY